MTFSDALIPSLIDFLRGPVRQEILAHFRNLGTDDISSKSAPDDLVTIADKNVEDMIGQYLRNAAPGAILLGEEAVASNPDLLSSYCAAGDPEQIYFIVDPIDGTWNFAHDLPIFGVMIAAVQADQVLLGLLYDPVLDEYVLALPGKGAWHHRAGAAHRRLAVSTRRQDKDLNIFLSTFSLPLEERQEAIARLNQFGQIKSLRCACYEQWLIASGAFDAGFFSRAYPWDHAAGSLVLREAGGSLGELDGTDYSPRRVGAGLLVANSRPVLERLRQEFIWLKK